MNTWKYALWKTLANACVYYFYYTYLIACVAVKYTPKKKVSRTKKKYKCLYVFTTCQTDKSSTKWRVYIIDDNLTCDMCVCVCGKERTRTVENEVTFHQIERTKKKSKNMKRIKIDWPVRMPKYESRCYKYILRTLRTFCSVCIRSVLGIRFPLEWKNLISSWTTAMCVIPHVVMRLILLAQRQSTTFHYLHAKEANLFFAVTILFEQK